MNHLSWRIGCYLLLTCITFATSMAAAGTKFHRIAWDQDPSRNAVIGFSPDGASNNPYLRYGYTTQENNWSSAQVSSTENFDGLTSHFVRLSGLNADAPVYYRVCDQDGCGQRFWFRTAPRDNAPYVVVAGGDTRTGWTNRRQGNQLVAKIRPLFVMHGGDFTNANSNSEMQSWLSDWTLTYSSDEIDGRAYQRIYPLIPTHGNHEDNNYATLCEVFGVDYNQDGRCNPADTYGAFNISPLLRVYTLNSQFKESGWSSYAASMNSWLENDLSNNGDTAVWRFAQYHKPMFPHSTSKSDSRTLYDWWAQEFYTHAMNLVVESDTHISKLTQPLVPSGNNFSETTAGGTVYVGEGSWGAPARSANDPKSWTIDLASIQQFKVIQVASEQLNVRTAQFYSGASTLSWNERAADSLVLPTNVDWWSAAEIGENLRLVQNSTKRSVISNGNGSTGGTSSIVLPTLADTFISSRQSNVNHNGHNDGLLADGSDSTYGELMALVKFNLAALPECADVENASVSLSIDVNNASAGNYAVYQASADWQENSVSWSSVGGSAIQGPFITTFAPTSSGTLQVNLAQTGLLNSWLTNGNTGLVIASNGTSDGLDFSSRETGTGPELEVSYETLSGCGDSGNGDGGGNDDGGGTGNTGGDTPTSANTLENASMANNEYLRSANGAYRFYLQGDGNLVLRDWNTRDSLWSSGTNGDGGTRLSMQSDGNLVLYTASGNPVWASNTNGTDASRLTLNNDGSLALYSDAGAVIWSVNGDGQTGDGGGDNGGGDNGGGDSGGGNSGGGNSGQVNHIGSTADYSGSGNVDIDVPSGTREGDLLMLFLSRTDDVLPVRWNGWTAGASCYKTDNGQSECHVISDCVDQRGDYCRRFDGGNGRDLATVVFYRTARANEPGSYRFNMDGDKPGWAILSTLRGVDVDNPIRDVNQESNDRNADSLFPSVYGETGDLLMLSQAFDDTTDRDDFRAPDGMEMFRWIAGSDEAGYVYGENLSSNGESGSRKTRGPGGPNAKDALISLTVRAATADGDNGNDGDGGNGNGDGGDGTGGDGSGGDGSGGDGSGGGSEPNPGTGNGTLRMADSSVTQGQPVVVEYLTGSGSTTDWIGIYAQGTLGASCTADQDYLDWRYTNGVSGSASLGESLGEGNYIAQLFSNDSYCHLGEALSFSVVSAGSGGGDGSGGDGSGGDGSGDGNNGGNPQVDEVSRAAGILVGGAGSAQPGHALYVFDNDQGASGSTCTGGCANAWPPLLVNDSAASGVSGLGSITRADGTQQATFNGQPLYFFAQDTMPGDTLGDGVNDVWWLAEGSRRDNDGGSGDGGGGDSTGTGGDTATSTNSLRNQSMQRGERITSSNGAYRLSLQSDGNLVLRNTAGDALWSSQTNGDGATRLSMQSDGNLVLYTASGAAVWASGTNGSGADRAVLNNDGSFAIYAGNTPVWAVNGDGMTGDGNSSGGDDVGDTVANQTLFSSPDAALYSLNDSEQRVFPEYINTNFNGNGHTQSWDGRIIIVTRSQGWFAAPMRPERITRGSDGIPNFRNGFFGNTMLLEADDDAPDMQHNWIAMVPDNAVTTENPYPSDANGNYRLNGSYATYKAIMYHTSKRNGDNDQMGIQRATFVVRDAYTPNAELVTAEFTTEFQRLRRSNGQDVRCIEMTVTMDGRLLVCQGHPDNNGRIDNLVYSWNPTPNSLTGWTTPRSVADMYYVDRQSDVAGIPFRVRYPLAEFPLRDAAGTPYQQGDLVKGAYPWISRDGSEVFYQASREGVSARRTATSVFGRWTGGAIRHIDGPINRDRSATSKLFLSSPGAFTTMWQPYKDVPDLKIPYSVRGPAYPIIGSNTRDYSEVDFNDYLDGNYVLALGMNEQIDRSGSYLTDRTPDTSGNFNNARLQNGAAFPQEYNGNDRLEGRFGQGIYFPSGSYLSVDKNAGWASLQNGITVDFFVRKVNSSSSDITLFELSNGLRIFLDNGSTLSAVMQDESGASQSIAGGNVGSAWTHVAFRFDPQSGAMALFINGQQSAGRTVNGFGQLNVGGQLRIGPVNSNGLLMLDEVHVSNVARAAYEIGHNAYADTHEEPGSALANTIPEHLDSLRDQAFNVDQFSFAAAELGELLFNDVILSRERSTSCATCHDPGRTFTDGLPIAQGNESTDAGERNTPMLQNRLFSSFQGWGGLSATLDTQALDPIQAAHEMNLPISQALQRLRTEGGYAARFQQAFGEQPNAQNLPRALASFQAIQFSPKTRVDEYLEGNKSVLSAAERRGLNLFFGNARCSGCHSGDNYTDESFRNNGLAQNGDTGRARETGRLRDDRLFKVPSLRSVAHTAPYMHDGSIATLRGVVERYNEGALGIAGVDTDIRPLELSNQQIDDLVAFMTALSGDGGTDSGSGSDPGNGSGNDTGGGNNSGGGNDSGGGNAGGDTNSDPVSADNTLGLDSLRTNEFLSSNNGDYRLFMQGDGNLVLRDWRTMDALWSSATNGSGVTRLSMQSDGNLVLYTAASTPVWATSTNGTPANRLTLNNDGSLGLYSNAGLVLKIYDDGVNFDGALSTTGSEGGNSTGGNSTAGTSEIGGEGWTLCANENGFCGFSGSRVVAYGENGQFKQLTFNGGVQCSNAVFGDPLQGVPKKCWYQDAVGASNNTPPVSVQLDQVTVTQTDAANWHSVVFAQAFAQTPAVVMGPPGYNGAQPTAVRVRNVTRTGFEFQIDEWDYLDGGHAAETLAYLAVTPGVHDWNGMRVAAGQVNNVTHGWTSVSYNEAFSVSPVVLAQQVSDNGAKATTTRLRSGNAGGFQVRVQEEEANGSHVGERVDYISISPGNSRLAEGTLVSAGFTGDRVTHNWFSQSFGRNVTAPRIFAGMQTFDGADTATVRYRNLSASGVQFKVEEEQSRDSEIRHTSENLGWVVFGQ